VSCTADDQIYLDLGNTFGEQGSTPVGKVLGYRFAAFLGIAISLAVDETVLAQHHVGLKFSGQGVRGLFVSTAALGVPPAGLGEYLLPTAESHWVAFCVEIVEKYSDGVYASLNAGHLPEQHSERSAEQ
jgi:hypothetical protein